MTSVEQAPAGRGGWEGAFTALERVLVAIAGLAILASGSITCVSIVGRWLFGWSVPDGEIIVRDLMIVACVLPLSVVVGKRAHISVDLIVRHFSDRTRHRINVFNGCIGVLILVAIAWSGWLNFATAWTRNSYFDGRLEWWQWPGRLVFFVGYALFVARSLHRIGDDPSEAQEIPPAQEDLPGARRS